MLSREFIVARADRLTKEDAIPWPCITPHFILWNVARRRFHLVVMSWRVGIPGVAYAVRWGHVRRETLRSRDLLDKVLRYAFLVTQRVRRR